MGRHQSNPTRREFLTAVAATGGAMLLGQNQLRAAEVDPRVAQIVSRTIAVDMHNHLPIKFVKDAMDSSPDPAIDLSAEIRRSGFTAICQTFAVDNLVNKEPGGYYKQYLQGIAFEDKLLANNRMRRALTMKDLETAHAQRQPIIVQSVEGAEFLEGRMERIEEVYKRGLRHMQLLHEQDDTVSPLGDVYTAPAAHLGGLTARGAEVIQECERLGIVVDMAHGTSETVMGALKVARQPFLVSHPGLTPAPANGNMTADFQRRMLNKDTALAVAAAGGVIGIWGRIGDTMKEFVAALKYMVETLGVDHVGIGTDTNMMSSNQLPYTNQIWPDQNAGFFPAVAGEMLIQGFTPDEIGKIGGGNFCRVFAKVTAGHA
jgi:membrane dipeptidase